MALRRHEALTDLLAELEAKAEAARASGDHTEPSAEEATGDCQTLPAKSSIPTPVVDAGPTPKPAPIQPRPQQTEAVSEPAKAPATRHAPTGRERRAEARHAVDTGAAIFFIDVRARITGRILDLSISGCRIRTDERFPVGIYRRVETEFKVDGLPFRLVGVVQSLHDRFTVGIRFLDLSSRKREQLAQLMEEIENMRAAASAENE